MKKLILLSMLSIILVSACVSDGFGRVDTDQPIDPSTGYIAFKPPAKTNFSLTLLNLDTNKKVIIGVSSDKHILYSLTPGNYGIITFNAMADTSPRQTIVFTMRVPLEMMRAIKIEPGTAVYIGDITLRAAGKGVEQIYDYNLLQARRSLSETYLNMSDIKVVSF